MSVVLKTARIPSYQLVKPSYGRARTRFCRPLTRDQVANSSYGRAVTWYCSTITSDRLGITRYGRAVTSYYL